MAITVSAPPRAQRTPATAGNAAPPQIEPLDEYNQKLLNNVHPSGWTNPEPKGRYHLVVIGAGTAGLVSAAGTAGLGGRVAIIERHFMGGDCLNVGCVPSKGVISAARSWHAARESGRVFGGPSVDGGENFALAMQRMRKLRAGISDVDGAPRYRDLGIDVFLGNGRFISPVSAEVNGAVLNFRRAVVATGARAAAPPFPGLEETGYRTNENIFWLTELPRRLLVIGAGPIGCELAQSFARFGSQVTIFNRGPKVLPREDMDAARIVEAAMARDGVHFVHGADITKVERRGADKVICGKTRDGAEICVAGDEILVAIGRAPNIEGLGLEAAGVQFDKSGVQVNDRLQTTNRRIFAAGDVCSKYQFTHAADFMARIVIANANFFGRGKASNLVMPWATYTSPEIAHVGYYEKDAIQAGHRVDTVTVPLHEVDRAVLDGQDEGFLRVHLKKGTDRILGATLVAEHAGDMIGELALAITAGVGLSKVGQTIHPYPTQGEVFRKAADAWRRTKLTPAVKKTLMRYFRLFQ